MRKSFINVSVYCALALASSAMFVGCADYDGDIKNLQEQIDGVSSKFDVSKEELTSLVGASIDTLKAAMDVQVTELQQIASGNATEIANLQAEIAGKVSELQANIDGKADASVVEANYTELQSLINSFNEAVNGSLDAAKTELEGKIEGLQSEQGNLSAKLQELSEKMEGAATEAEIESLKAEMEEVNASLESTNNSLVDALNRLKAVEDAKYGEKIAALETRIVKLENLEATLEAYTDAEIQKLNASLSAKITTELAAVKSELSAEDSRLAGLISTVEGKIDNYISSHDQLYQTLFQKVQALEQYKDNTLASVLAGKADASALSDAVDDIDDLDGRIEALELMFAEGGDYDLLEGKVNQLGTDIDALEKELRAMMGIMVQSIVYEPNYVLDGGNNAVLKPLAFNRLQVKNLSNNNYVNVTENQTSVVKFRVTPVSAAENFAENYNIAFNGYAVTRAAANYLTAEYNATESDLERGVVAYTVKRSESFGVNSTYCLSALVTPKDPTPEEGTQNLTEIASNYFIASHKDVQVDKIVVESKYMAAGTYNFQWNTTNYYDLKEGYRLVGYNSNTKVVADLEAEYGKIFTVSYALAAGVDTKAFSLSNGILSLNEKVSSHIGKKATVTAKAEVAGCSYTTNYLAEFTITKALVEYTRDAIETTWKSVASKDSVITVELNSIANKFSMGIGDLKTLLANTSICKTSIPAALSGKVSVATNDGIVVTINQSAEIATDENIVITLKGEGTSSTTLSGTEYTITIPVQKTAYPTTYALTRNTIFWDTETQFTLDKRVDKEDNVGLLTLEMDVKPLFNDFANQIAAIKANGGVVTITTTGATTNATFDSSTGNTSDAIKFVINKDNYQGAKVQLSIKVAYGSKSETKVYDVKISDLAGTITVNTNAIELTSKTDVKTLTGFKWVDYNGRTMWENGKTVDSGTDMEAGVYKYQFASDPFDIYAMDAPTIVMNDPNGLVEYKDGQVSLSEPGQNYTYTGKYEGAKLIMTVKKPKWGELQNLGSLASGKYTIEIPVIVNISK